MKNNNKKTTVKIQKLVLGKINIQSCSLQYKHNNFLPFQEMCQNFKKKRRFKEQGSVYSDLNCGLYVQSFLIQLLNPLPFLRGKI